MLAFFLRIPVLGYSWNSLLATTKMEQTMCAKLPIGGCPVAQQVHILPLLRVLDCLPTHASVNHNTRQNHRQVTEAPCLCKCKVTGRLWHWGFYRYSVRASDRQHSHPYGGVSGALALCLLARTAGGHSLEKERRQ